jgi:hypothetical protein
VVLEYDAALQTAKFVDDAGKAISLTPATWQVGLGYQFDWNPWAQEIGQQGTFAALGYSQSRDLAGVTLTQRIHAASLRNRAEDGKVYPWRVGA